MRACVLVGEHVYLCRQACVSVYLHLGVQCSLQLPVHLFCCGCWFWRKPRKRMACRTPWAC